MDFSFDIFDINILNKIKVSAQKNKYKEVCGFIYLKDNKQYIYESKNISSDPKNFFATSIGDYETCSKIGQVIACFHSHTRNMTFTHEDIENCFASKINYLLYVIPQNQFYFFDQEKHAYMKKYMNKQFHLGQFDCYDLLENFYKDELKIILPSRLDINKINLKDSLENPYLLIPNSFNLNWVIQNDFNLLSLKDIKKLKPYDILILDGDNIGKPTHFGIYLPNKMLLHHNYAHPKYGNRSIYECYRKAHERFLLYVLRHKNFMS